MKKSLRWKSVTTTQEQTPEQLPGIPSAVFYPPFTNVDIVGVFCRTPLPQAALRRPKLSVDLGTACAATPKGFVPSFSLATLIHR